MHTELSPCFQSQSAIGSPIYPSLLVPQLLDKVPGVEVSPRFAGSSHFVRPLTSSQTGLPGHSGKTGLKMHGPPSGVSQTKPQLTLLTTI